MNQSARHTEMVTDAPGPVPAAEQPWSRLDRRTVAATALTIGVLAAAVAVPFGVGMVRDDGEPIVLILPLGVGAVLLLAGAAAVVDWLRWRHTAYRITPERVELRFSLVLHKVRSIPRERIRTVDLTANPFLRVFGLSKVKIGTGQSGGSDSHLTLDPVDRAGAERLRRDLLEHAGTRAAESPATPGALAELDWRWIRYAPVSVSTPLLGAAALGGLWQLSGWLEFRRPVLDWFNGLGQPIPMVVVMLIAAGLLIGVVGSLGLFVEMWWNYRLTRERGMLSLRRGLLTTRSLSLEQQRLRGVDVVESMTSRMMGAARVDVVATGLRTKSNEDNNELKTVLPDVPRGVAHRIATAVLGGSAVAPEQGDPLRAHPVAARGRRLRWAAFAVLAVMLVLVVLGAVLTPVLWHAAWLSALVLVPVAVVLALDAYRNLGHRIGGDYLMIRSGVGSRHTVALLRRGVIGWTIRSSPFQRRAGLVTIAATTAASEGEYLVRDVGYADGLRLADTAVPGLLGPFLERTELTGD